MAFILAVILGQAVINTSNSALWYEMSLKTNRPYQGENDHKLWYGNTIPCINL